MKKEDEQEGVGVGCLATPTSRPPNIGITGSPAASTPQLKRCNYQKLAHRQLTVGVREAGEDAAGK